MKKKVFTEEDRELAKGPYMDSPDAVETDKSAYLICMRI